MFFCRNLFLFIQDLSIMVKMRTINRKLAAGLSVFAALLLFICLTPAVFQKKRMQ